MIRTISLKGYVRNFRLEILFKLFNFSNNRRAINELILQEREDTKSKWKI